MIKFVTSIGQLKIKGIIITYLWCGIHSTSTGFCGIEGEVRTEVYIFKKKLHTYMLKLSQSKIYISDNKFLLKCLKIIYYIIVVVILCSLLRMTTKMNKTILFLVCGQMSCIYIRGVIIKVVVIRFQGLFLYYQLVFRIVFN